VPERIVPEEAVEVTVEGTRPRVPLPVDLVAYRIVQEALTNVVCHAAAGRAHVLVAYDPGVIRLTIRDDGTGSAASGTVPNRASGVAASGVAAPAVAPGQGLTGMRERARSVGGRVTAGPRPGGGFEVRAELPLIGAGGSA
jgi:signal transduction histidine kinase